MDSYLDFSLKKVEYLMELEVLTILDFSGSQPGLMKARFIEVKVPRSETEVLNGSTLIPQRIKEEAEKEVLHGSTLVPQQKKEAGGVEEEEYRVVYAILMPRYSTSVAKSPKFLPRNLLVQFSKLVEALNYMHLKGIVHLDIKADNIFVDAEGEWVLGDFGSCKRIDQIVGSTTPLYHYERISGQKAKPAFDYYMLLVTLLIELLPDKHDFIDALTECQGGVTRASFRKVQTAASKYKVEIPSVKNLIENLERLST
jgi:serine/threonine protein kinase